MLIPNHLLPLLCLFNTYCSRASFMVMLEIAILNEDRLRDRLRMLLQKAQEAIEFLGAELPADSILLIL